MKNCEYFEDLISSLIDGEITDEEKDELLKHMESCPKCRELYQDYRIIFADGKSVSPPDELLKNVMAEIEKMPAPVKKSNRKHFIKYIAAAAACFAIVLIAGKNLFPAVKSESASNGAAYNGMAGDDENQPSDSLPSDTIGDDGKPEFSASSDQDSFYDGEAEKITDAESELENLGLYGYEDGLYIIYIESTLPDFLSGYPQETLDTGLVLIFPDEEDLEKLDEYPSWDLSLDRSAKTAVLFKP